MDIVQHLRHINDDLRMLCWNSADTKYKQQATFCESVTCIPESVAHVSSLYIEMDFTFEGPWWFYQTMRLVRFNLTVTGKLWRV